MRSDYGKACTITLRHDLPRYSVIAVNCNSALFQRPSPKKKPGSAAAESAKFLSASTTMSKKLSRWLVLDINGAATLEVVDDRQSFSTLT